MSLLVVANGLYLVGSSSSPTALAATPVALTAPSGEGQRGAIEYAPDGSAYDTLGERETPPFTLKRVDRR